MTQTFVPLIRTKIQPPPARPGQLRRARLLELLEQASRRRVAIVSAPAGFGKTTLVAEWASSRRDRVAWVSLDEADSDAARFLEYVIESIRQVDEGLLSDLGSVIGGSQSIPAGAILTGIVNELADTGRDVVLVLDDHHVIESTSVFDAITFLVDRGPANLHVMLVGREDPPLPLPRYRVSGTLAEIRAEDLRFNRDESGALLVDTMGLPLSGNDVDMLDERTEGWAASLQLAALSLQGRSGSRAVIDSLAASDRYVIDFLVDEVIENLPQRVQHFLQRTSVLDRLSPDLCDHVLGESGSALLLEEIERRNLFLTPVDERRSWYRYHQLFRSLLRQRLDAAEPGESSRLLLAASEYSEEHGDLEGALRYALAAGAHERAADLASVRVVDLVNEGYVGTVIEWTDLIARDAVLAHPMLTMARAWACFMNGRVDETRELIAAVESNPDGPRAQEAAVHAEVLRTFLALTDGNPGEALRLAAHVMERVDDTVAILRSALAFNMGLAHLELGEMEPAEAWLVRASESGLGDASYYVALAAISHRTEIAVARGDLRRAEELAVQALRMGVEWGGGTPLPATGYAQVSLGEIMFERNDIDAARRHFDTALDLGTVSGDENMLLLGHHGLSMCAEAKGMHAEAIAHMERACALLSETLPCTDSVKVAPWRAQFALLRGEPHEALRIYESANLCAGSPLADRHERLVRIRALIAIGDLEGALAEASERVEQSGTRGSVGEELRSLVLRAVILARLGRHAESVRDLDLALSGGREVGLVRSLLEPKEDLLPLLQEIVRSGDNADYAMWLLEIAESGSAGPIEREPGELLTEREREVLGLLGEGLTYQEIADRLYVSLNTVRTHTKSVYAKLGANTRVGALEEARRRERG